MVVWEAALSNQEIDQNPDSADRTNARKYVGLKSVYALFYVALLIKIYAGKFPYQERSHFGMTSTREWLLPGLTIAGAATAIALTASWLPDLDRISNHTVSITAFTTGLLALGGLTLQSIKSYGKRTNRPELVADAEKIENRALTVVPMLNAGIIAYSAGDNARQVIDSAAASTSRTKGRENVAKIVDYATFIGTATMLWDKLTLLFKEHPRLTWKEAAPATISAVSDVGLIATAGATFGQSKQVMTKAAWLLGNVGFHHLSIQPIKHSIAPPPLIEEAPRPEHRRADDESGSRAEAGIGTVSILTSSI